MSNHKTKGSAWTSALARIFAFTFLSTLLTFAVALLLSILGTVIHAAMKRTSPDLMFAYKHIAFPIAITAGALVLVGAVFVEIRNHRQSQVLAAIERAALNH